jgi:hypothetical protein
MAACTPQEKVRVRHHMGYLNVAEAFTFVMGTPAGVETQFLIEGALNRLLDDAMPELRRILAACDQVEQQMLEYVEALGVSKLGQIEIDPKLQQKLRSEYDRWVAALANLLGVPRNPFDNRTKTGGVNARVQG